MIDVHCHLLPGIDDGSSSLRMSLEMARIALEDGITDTVCTPHIYPGVFPNERGDICRRVGELSGHLSEAGMALRITHGADIQIVPELVQGLRSGRMASINDSRYFLFEPPHFVVPTRFAQLLEDVLAAGYVPIITHPERLTWLDEAHYGWFVDAAFEGAWIQLTADALTGRFGKVARRWSERFLADGLVHLLASDGHDDRHRPPVLSAGRRIAEHWVGADEAERMVLDRPSAVLSNADPLSVVPPPALAEEEARGVSMGVGGGVSGLLKRFFHGASR
ncbi:MAG: capsular biosynthesis protein [Thiocapsa sp.]|uniref:tyrosine-protein phosphatase n=1 Tax=Thiocapsa sp. TaxID=2024551 RepID=UPI001BCB07AE|nr:CpsB/CapC family capsule biosynthesis tyrosine phosphatase [Thiocapsa sp.]QVL50056.1 MAG: capsular biosynthesis protein [Thiocapsa sp.]